jgi:hypothetical protein
MLRHLATYLPQTTHVSAAAAIDPSTQILIGDPTQVGARTAGILPSWRHDQVQAPPTDKIATAAFGPHLTKVATDLATRLLNELRLQ